MSEQNTVARAIHDLGLAAWFGGSLMGAIGLNGASAEVSDRRERTAVANAGWRAWTPVNIAAGLAAALAGAQMTKGNAGRLAAQSGAGSVNATKGVLMLAAAVASVYARILGKKVEKASADTRGPSSDGAPAEGGTTPAADTPDDVAAAQRQLDVLQWVVPGLTGATLVLNAKAGEQQRPRQVLRGVLSRG